MATVERAQGRGLAVVDGRVHLEETRKFRPDIYWYLSFRCSLACKHCSVHSSPWVDTSGDLGTEQCLDVVDQMAELNVRVAIMTGGEVLMRPDAEVIMQAVADRGMGVGLESNGIKFLNSFLDQARTLQTRGQFSMTVSVDGGNSEAHDMVRGNGAFQRTVANLHRLKEAGIDFSIQAVLNNRSWSSIPDLFRLARALRPRLSTLMFGFLNPVGRGQGLIAELGLGHGDLLAIYDLIERERQDYDGEIIIKAPPAAVPPRHLKMMTAANVHGCTTCQFPLLGVLPNGDVTVCALSRENSDLYFGNVKSLRLKAMWEKARMDLLRSEYVAAEHLQGICGDCVWSKACKGSCRAWAYEAGGSFDAPFPICQSMADTGMFPSAYRISVRDQAVAAFQLKSGQLATGCSCA